jgi:hypothetical protein
MRKGFDGLALLAQETLERNPHNGHLFVFCGTTGKACACSRSGWNEAALSGHLPLPAKARIGRRRSRRRSPQLFAPKGAAVSEPSRESETRALLQERFVTRL